MGTKPTHLPAFASWYTGAGILGVQLRVTTLANGSPWIRQSSPPATFASATAAFDHAAMAFDAEQSIPHWLPTDVSSAGATNPAYGIGFATNACLSNIVSFVVYTSKDSHGPGPETYVSVC